MLGAVFRLACLHRASAGLFIAALLSVAALLFIPACSGAPDPTPQAPEAAGGAQPLDPSAPAEAGAASVAPHGKHAPCTLGADQLCNDDPAVSALWGRCTELGVCECNPGFELNPVSAHCRPVP